MNKTFDHGYAVVVGVDASKVAPYALPTVAKDVRALYDVLTHPQRCAYKKENVKLLHGEQATKQNILDALYWLEERIDADPEATAVIYYSGHGMQDNKRNRYYLIPFDIKLSRVRDTALRADDFAERVLTVDARRVLVMLDCCHAAGMDVKEIDLAAINAKAPILQSQAFPLDLPDTKAITEYDTGAKAVSELAEGEGRAILNSSTSDQSSYIRSDHKMSVFTYHLIEALTGHAPHAADDTTVLVTDLMSWVQRRVKLTAEEMGRAQTPVMRTNGVFPVAQLIGGAGLAKGVTAPNPLASLPEVTPQVSTHVEVGSGAAAVGEGAVAVGERGVNVGGNVGGSIVTGDMQGDIVQGNKVEKQIDAREAQIGVMGEHAKVEGGIQFGDKIDTGGGDLIKRDKIVQGDEVKGDKFVGDKVGGDKIDVGNISRSSGIAIGRGSSATVTQTTGADLDAISLAFKKLYETLENKPQTPQKTMAVQAVENLEAEARKGNDAQETTVKQWLDILVSLLPDVAEVAKNTFINSIQGVSFVFQNVAEGLQLI